MSNDDEGIDRYTKPVSESSIRHGIEFSKASPPADAPKDAKTNKDAQASDNDA